MIKKRLFISSFSLVLLCASLNALAAGVQKNAPLFPDLESVKGQPVLVDFWASWCGPCRESFPWMNEIKEKYPELKVIAVNLDEDRSDAESFLEKFTNTVDIFFDPEGELAEKYDIQAMPSSYLIDRSGKIVKTHVGFFDNKKDEYEEAIKKLLLTSVK